MKYAKWINGSTIKMKKKKKDKKRYTRLHRHHWCTIIVFFGWLWSRSCVYLCLSLSLDAKRKPTKCTAHTTSDYSCHCRRCGRCCCWCCVNALWTECILHICQMKAIYKHDSLTCAVWVHRPSPLPLVPPTSPPLPNAHYSLHCSTSHYPHCILYCLLANCSPTAECRMPASSVECGVWSGVSEWASVQKYVFDIAISQTIKTIIKRILNYLVATRQNLTKYSLSLAPFHLLPDSLVQFCPIDFVLQYECRPWRACMRYTYICDDDDTIQYNVNAVAGRRHRVTQQ